MAIGENNNVCSCPRLSGNFHFQLMLKAPVAITFEITNSSQMTIHYSWDLGMTPEVISRNVYTLAISEKQGHASSESQVDCRLTVTGLRKTVIKNHRVLLKVPLSNVDNFHERLDRKSIVQIR